MAWTLKESDIKSLLKWARSDTKKFVSAGFKGNINELGKILSTYNFFATLDSSMASMIIAFIICCIKSGNSDLKKFGLSALRDGSSLNKLFEYLKEGNGKKVKYYMGSYFQAALGTVLQTALPDDKDNGIDNKDKRAKIIKSFINRAGKITPWKINGGKISDVIDRFIGNASKEANKAMMQKEAIKNAPNAHHKMMKEEAYDKRLKKLKEERDDDLEKVKSNADNKERIKQIFESEPAYTNKLKELKEERDGELEKVKSEFTEDKKGAAKSAAKNAVENAAKIRASKQPLLDAINSNDLESVKQIIKLYPQLLSLPLDSFGNTALLHAADKGQERIVDLLLEKGADPNIQNDGGWTPLHIAANERIANLLLDHRADLDIQDDNGWTPLHMAAIEGLRNEERGRIINLLLDRGADTDITDNQGRTYQDILHPQRRIHVADFPQDEIRHSLENGETRQCPICFDEYGAEDLCYIFQCEQNSKDYPFGHYFCNECAQGMLDTTGEVSLCPLCRKGLKPH